MSIPGFDYAAYGLQPNAFELTAADIAAVDCSPAGLADLKRRNRELDEECRRREAELPPDVPRFPAFEEVYQPISARDLAEASIQGIKQAIGGRNPRRDAFILAKMKVEFPDIEIPDSPGVWPDLQDQFPGVKLLHIWTDCMQVASDSSAISSSSSVLQVKDCSTPYKRLQFARLTTFLASCGLYIQQL